MRRRMTECAQISLPEEALVLLVFEAQEVQLLSKTFQQSPIGMPRAPLRVTRITCLMP